MAKSKEKDVAPAGPKLLQVAPPMALLWPFNPQPARCEAFSIVAEDDPLLDTTQMDPALAREFNVQRFNQRDRLMAAPAGAVLTPHADYLAHELYRRLGYADAAYQPDAVAEAARAAAAELAKPPKPALRTEPATLQPGDLDIPARIPATEPAAAATS